MSETMGTVYALFDPRNPRVPKYVGRTSSHIRQRLYSHMSWAYQNHDRPLAVWIMKLEAENIIPTITVLETVPIDELQTRETFWIRFYKPLGCLLNRSEGPGSLGLKLGSPSPENIQKTIERNKRGWSESQRKNWKAKMTGRKLSEAHRKAVMQSPVFAENRKLFLQHSIKTRKPVVCVETGQKFESIASVAKFLSRNERGLGASIRQGFCIGGFHWKILPPQEQLEKETVCHQ